MNILIIGATGYVGSSLLDFLCESHTVYATVRSLSKIKQDPRVHYCEVDLTTSCFEKALPKEVDVIIYLPRSRYHRGFPEKAEDMYAVHVNALFRILEWARKETKVQHFIYSSTANVYEQAIEPLHEESKIAPSCFYGATKMMGEMLIESYASYFPCSILRLFTVYGPGQMNALIPVLFQKVLKGETVQIYGDEGMTLTPIFIKDLCEMVLRVIQVKPNKNYRVFNIASNEFFSIFEITKHLSTLLCKDMKVEYVQHDGNMGWTANNKKFIHHFQYDKFTSFYEGLKKTVDAYFYHKDFA